MTASDFPLSARRGRESFQSYVRKSPAPHVGRGSRVLRGVPVLRIPVIVYQKHIPPIRYSETGSSHVISICFSVENQHYDAIIKIPVTPLLAQ